MLFFRKLLRGHETAKENTTGSSRKPLRLHEFLQETFARIKSRISHCGKFCLKTQKEIINKHKKEVSKTNLRTA